MSSTSTSRSLLARARDRDPLAWERLIELYTPLVLHWAQASGLRGADAADVVQDVFHTAARYLDGFRKENPGDSFRAWLRTLTRTRTADHFRLKERVPDPMGSEVDRQAQSSDSLASVVSEEILVRDLLARALEELRGRVQENTYRAFELVVLGGRSPADVAEELGMQVGAVRVAKSRMLRRLRDVLGEPPVPH